jgi:hypothetical protein
LDPDLEPGRKDVGEHDCLLITDIVRQEVEGILSIRYPDIFGLRPINQVTEDPTDSRSSFITHAVRIQARLAVGTMATGFDAGDDYPVTRL